MDINEMLGAVYGWVWCRWCRCHAWAMLYWPSTRSERRSAQVPRSDMARPWSGYRDHRRGRHWDRRRR
jgi:hypothetical protein